MASTWVLPILFCCLWTYGQTLMLPVLADPPLKVGAFNIQIFGEKKYNIKEVRKYLIKIIKCYDLLLVQEIRDREERYMEKLLSDVNSVGIDACTGKVTHGELSDDQHYAVTISKRLGTSNIKEQYAYIYRKNRLTLLRTYQYPKDKGQFERPPYVASFESLTTELEKFVIIGDHTKPKHALSEIDSLRDVYDTVLTEFGDQAKNVLIAGDLNADCSYLHKEEKAKLRIRQGSLFNWLIKEDTDTTVGNSDCAYDRFITAGPGWDHAIVPGSIGIFNFEKKYGLSHALSEDISDHFPVEFELQGKQHEENQQNTKTQMTVEITNEEKVNLANIRSIYHKSTKLPENWTVKQFKVDNKNHHVEASLSNQVPGNVTAKLQEFNMAVGGNVISPRILSFVESYINQSSFGKQSYVYGLKIKRITEYDLTVKCGLVPPYICSVRVTKLEFDSNSTYKRLLSLLDKMEY